MNKKVLTLCAGFLLAGGLTVPAFAESFAEVATNAVNLENQYYYVYVNAGTDISNDDTNTNGSGILDAKDSQGWVSVANASKSSMWTVKKVDLANDLIGYQLINVESGEAFSVESNDVTYDTFICDVTTGYKRLIWINANNQGYAGPNSVLTAQMSSWYYNLQPVAPVTYTDVQLESILDGKFGIKIGYQEDTNKNSKIDDNEWYEYASYEGGNAFEGDLYVGAGNTTDGFAIYKDAKLTQRVVLTKSKWEEVSSALSEGYRFDVLSTKEYDAEVDKNANSNILADKFLFSVPSTVKGDPIEVVAVESDGTKHELVVSVVNKADNSKINRLTVAAVEDFTYANYYLNNGENDGNTYVKFGASNAVNTQDFIGKLWNVYKNGRILSPDCNLADDNEWIAASEINVKGAEGLWMWNEDAKSFINRESGKEYTVSGWRYTDTEYTYTSGEDEYTIVAQGNPAPDGTTDGYLASLTDDQLKQKAFFIGTPRTTNNEVDTVYLVKEANGVLSFSLDKTEAVEFRFTREAFGDQENKMEAQLRGEYSAWKANSTTEWEPKTDIVKLYQYSIKEAVTGDVLYYDDRNDQYILADEEDLPDGTELEKYVLKEKGEDLYNILLNVVATYNGADNAKYYEVEDGVFCGYTDQWNGIHQESAAKLYGAHNTARLVKSDEAYENVENDLFVIVDADAQQYRGDFSNTGVLDTIKIFRNDDNSYVLYEKGALLMAEDGKTALEGFLGMENIYDPEYADMHAAMLADTAIHANTFRPQYMLAVDADIVPAGKWCEEHQSSTCAHAVPTDGYVTGRYLVNLVDSAKAATKAGVKFADNKFVHEYYVDQKTPYYRLGFVQAKHIGDSLIIASTNDTIDLKNTSIDKVCTFAFRYVDAEREAFTIETLYNYELDADGDIDHDKDQCGYIKYHNGIPVVTPQPAEAWVFNLEETSDTPTANETIESAADATISVVATDGAVIVKGAEGKNVVVSTILGKVVANEVLNSDNETIAAPAGIVVVSVDGESFKVAVK